jgi:hypothetical protein
MMLEVEGGVPTVETDDLSTQTIDLLHEELRGYERMSGNLRRCGAYNGIVETIEANLAAQEVLLIRSARQLQRRGPLAGRTRHTKYLGSATNLVDLMRERIESPRVNACTFQAIQL